MNQEFKNALMSLNNCLDSCEKGSMEIHTIDLLKTSLEDISKTLWQEDNIIVLNKLQFFVDRITKILAKTARLFSYSFVLKEGVTPKYPSNPVKHPELYDKLTDSDITNYNEYYRSELLSFSGELRNLMIELKSRDRNPGRIETNKKQASNRSGDISGIFNARQVSIFLIELASTNCINSLSREVLAEHVVDLFGIGKEHFKKEYSKAQSLITKKDIEELIAKLNNVVQNLEAIKKN